MKKNSTKKIILIIISILLAIFIIYISEESIRLKKYPLVKPLIILDRTKYSISALEKGETVKIEYYSLGYKTIIEYYNDEESSDDNVIIRVISKEFLLFNKIRLWGWIT